MEHTPSAPNTGIVSRALVPMGSNESGEKWADQLVDMPIRAFCNGGDMFGAFTANDNGTIQKIKTLGGRKQEFTATNDAGHDCWDGVYSSGELFAWMLQQRRTHASTSAVLPRPTLSMVQPVVARLAFDPMLRRQSIRLIEARR